MRLRTRLIVAFLILSVVPLGAVTYYSYTSQVRALRELATSEADALSGEMTQRMQLVTGELTTRVEQLMDMQPVPVPVPVPAARTTVATAAPPPTPVEPAAETVVEVATNETQAAEALGAAAMLLKSVELRGARGIGRPSGGVRSNPGVPPTGQRTRPPRLEGDPARPPVPVAAGSSAAVADASKVADTPKGPEAPPVPPVAPVPPAVPAERIVIDMGAITREMFTKYVPEGGLGKLTSEQRQQIGREISQRMQGIAEGIRLSAEQLQKKADEAKLKPAPPATAVSPAPAKPAPAAPAASAPAPRRAPVPAPAPVTRASKLVGNRLDVTLSQGGKVVSQVNATIDLENVLATVFSPTRRERGEVAFAVGADGRVYTATDTDRKMVEGLGAVARPDGPLGKTVLRDWVVFTQTDPSGSGLRFGIARPVGDSLGALRRTAGRNAGLGLMLISLAIVLVVPLSGRLTRNLSALTEGVDRISHGDYRARVPVRSKDEIGDLALAFNKMAADVERHQQAAVEQERLHRELELGRQIQNDMLPREPMLFGLTQVQGVSIPAREVGGDFFNYFALENGQVALIVGDVSGKGVGAALLMANIQASLRTRLALGQSLADIAEAIDRDLAVTATTRLYVTLFLGVFDPATRRLQYVNAGHNPQFVLRPNQPIERMAATGIPIGLLAGRGYEQREVRLASGDLLFFYTDGCVETENEQDEMFGANRLESLLVSIATQGPVTPDRVLHQVEQSVTAFRGTREPFDDATMMAVSIG
jgi:serine phosphatase RsbU (regulator of sigma subunit)